MEPFRTVLNAGVSKHTIQLSHPIMTLGSCFSDSIGAQFQQSKIDTLINPFGTVYNPYSLHKLIRYAVFNELPADITFLQQRDVHLNYDFHSSLSSLKKDDLKTTLSNTVGTAHHF